MSWLRRYQRLGYGLAVKIDDGAQRAATAVMAESSFVQVLQKHGIGKHANAIEALTGHARFQLKNWNGATVGSVEPVGFTDQ